MILQQGLRSVILLAVAVTLLAACSPAAPAPEQARSTPTGLPVLRMVGEDYGYPQPYAFSRGPGHVLASYVFDTLIWHDADGLVPWLATEWQPSADGKTWVFRLRPGVRWHDGRPFTADDVVFTFQYLKEHPNSWWASQIELIEGVQPRGDDQVAISLARPYAPFLTQIAASVLIFPRHVWERVGDPTRFTAPEATIGTGPYRLSQYDQTQGTYLFDANPDFFLGEPYVKRLELVPAPNQLLALQQGQIDAAGAGTQDVPTDEVLAPFQDSGKFGTITAPREWTVGLFFNGARDGALADARFRRAVAYALDYPDLVARVLHGKGVPGNPGHVAPTSEWYNADVPRYTHDVARARQLLDEADYRDRDGDGVREAPDGRPLRFELTYTDWDSPRNAELIRGYLQAVGIAATPRIMDRTARDAAAAEGRYDLILVGFGGLGGDPDGLRAKFDSRSRMRSFNRVQGYHNPRFDELASQQVAEVDPARRKQIVDAMQAILAQDVPLLSLYHPQDVWIYRKGTLEDWYFASGWYGGGTNGSYKHVLVTGQKTGTTIRGK
jgi:peptide/nickel transport system substrate-binding protein